MLKYVEEEVDRVKGLFEQKEARLTGERDSAKQAAQQLAGEREELTQKLLRLEQQLQHLPAALEVRNSKLLAPHLLQAHMWPMKPNKRLVQNRNQLKRRFRHQRQLLH